ncbi:MAG: DVU_1551 family NTP transferase [Chloroflexota bacterium]|jgi:molybdenum cofactor cytidylyltransferase
MSRDSAEIVGLILAAGYSSRMGEFKPLLPIGESRAIERSVNSLLSAGVRDVRVVVGWRADELTPLLESMGATTIFNPDYQSGMYSSVLAGIGTLNSDVQAFLLLPADIPLVKPATIRQLIRNYVESDASIVYPRFLHRRGHPPIISTSCLEGAPSSDFTGGLRSVLSRFEESALEVEVVDQGILMDMDTAADYQALLDYFSRNDLPTEDECTAILSLSETPTRVVAHARKVADVARNLASRLNEKGLDLDVELAFTAALLHDVAKGQADHARAGARLISRFGFQRVAECVASHMELTYSAGIPLSEPHLVYLADKLVNEDQIISLREKIAYASERFAGQNGALEAAKGRLKVAEAIKSRIETLTGLPVEQIALEAEAMQ